MEAVRARVTGGVTATPAAAGARPRPPPSRPACRAAARARRAWVLFKMYLFCCASARAMEVDSTMSTRHTRMASSSWAPASYSGNHQPAVKSGRPVPGGEGGRVGGGERRRWVRGSDAQRVPGRLAQAGWRGRRTARNVAHRLDVGGVRVEGVLDVQL